MKHALTLALLPAFAVPAAGLQGAGPWEMGVIGQTLYAVPGDVDGDGDVDFFVDSGWVENAAGDGSAWVSHPGSDFWPGAAADVDGDGDLDVLGSNKWSENLAGDGTAWTEHEVVVESTPFSTYVWGAADVDGDGDVDALAIRYVLDFDPDPEVAWMENVAGDGSTWVYRPVWMFVSLSPFPRWIDAADVDGDGDQDLLFTRNWFAAPTAMWFENVSGDGSDWFLHEVGESGFHREIVGADFVGDGTLDLLVAGTGTDGALALYSNVDGDGTTWAHSPTAFPGAQLVLDLDAGDLDRDGDLDVVAIDRVAFGMQEVSWFEDTSGDGSNYVEHPLGTFASSEPGSDSQCQLVDIDGDGDLDVVALVQKQGSTGDLIWWRNDAPPMPGVFCEPVLMTDSLTSAFLGGSADVDRDGDLDLLLRDRVGDRIVWLENPDASGPVWTDHLVASGPGGPGGAEGARPADVDGDGDVDAFGLYDGDELDSLWWHENLTGDGSSWADHEIEQVPVTSFELETADLDGDGDLDALTGALSVVECVRWHENVAADGTSWSSHPLDPTEGRPTAIASADVDRDGDLDVLVAYTKSTTPFPGKLSWFENAAGDASAWIEHEVEVGTGGAQYLDTGDVDGDGDLDVLTEGMNDGLTSWYENVSGDGSLWSRHAVSNQLNSAQSARLADLDADGDLDFVVSDGVFFTPSRVYWYENETGDGLVWQGHVVEDVATIDSREVLPLDVDRDGDPDIVGLFNLQGDVEWFEHVRAAAVESVRLGTPPNPDALRPGLTSGPAIGSTWDPWVDHASFMPDASFDLLSLAVGPLNVPTQYGTVLCTPPLVTLVGAPGVPFAIPISEDCSLLGIGLCCQAASWNGTLAATNALDIVLGTY